MLSKRSRHTSDMEVISFKEKIKYVKTPSTKKGQTVQKIVSQARDIEDRKKAIDFCRMLHTMRGSYKQESKMSSNV